MTWAINYPIRLHGRPVPVRRRNLIPAAEQVLITFGAATHVGKVRARNEDHFAVVRRKRSREVLASNVALPTDLPDDEAYSLIVADGVGGEGFGDLASELAVRAGWESASHAASWLMKLDSSTAEEIRQQVAAVAQAIQQAFLKYFRENPEFAGWPRRGPVPTSPAGMRSLLMSATRAYHCRGGQALQVTIDHTLAEELAPLRRQSGPPDEVSQCVDEGLWWRLDGSRTRRPPAATPRWRWHLVMQRWAQQHRDRSGDRPPGVRSARPASDLQRTDRAGLVAQRPDNVTAVLARVAAGR